MDQSNGMEKAVDSLNTMVGQLSELVRHASVATSRYVETRRQPGTYVVVRSRDQGCMCGEYAYHVGREVGLMNARQIYSWSGGRLTLVDFAEIPGEVRLSRVATGSVTMLEACGIIDCNADVEEFLRTTPHFEQPAN